MNKRKFCLVAVIALIALNFFALVLSAQEASTSPATPSDSRWFDTNRFNVFITLAIVFGAILWFIGRAKKGKSLFVRRIAGLDAIEEAVGRATEMGKSVLYIPGIHDMNDIQTVASMIILGNVAKTIARYDIPLIVPIRMPFVVPVAEEAVRQGYSSAGRLDAFVKDNIRFISDEQFAYAAAVSGIMLRERPAANLLLGSFYAESLLLAETGASTGAIQVAGTANIHQLPFFIVACDYTLIGEELFAASAYLSREPKLLGSLKGSDLAKAVIVLAIILGTILETAGVKWFTKLFIVQ
ncbi:MAG: hypothetical protein A2145_04630 [candidate division Zixibacteria bacterium RBG_16_40_9]|nr:MAG: hypothetical protein A2145_04630 [candidate division Zixibacteria bacterium RBG_16_40_9]